MYNVADGEPIPAIDRESDLVGEGKFISEPMITCPSGGRYRLAVDKMVHQAGTVFVECDHPGHVPEDTQGW